MKIVFIDVDGVLNAFDWQVGCTSGLLDGDCVKRLDRIQRETGAKLVITSTWREYVHGKTMTHAGFYLMLKTHGLTSVPDSIIGVTERGPLRDRGDQIRSWLNNWPTCRDEVERFIAIDDMDLGHTARGVPLVLTNGRVGLTDRDADEAIRLLA